ncbi:MAG: hypothetical protein JO244_08045 [Solirubrobacterales bacterium]|nr:hypothetical protein [Solirubrobacterales bacterium]
MTEQPVPPERDVHDALNEPATDPDPTEWPDPYDKRPDPRDPGAHDLEMDFGDVHTPTGATSTSEPHHEVDPQVDPRKANPHEPDRPERGRRAGH